MAALGPQSLGVCPCTLDCALAHCLGPNGGEFPLVAMASPGQGGRGTGLGSRDSVDGVVPGEVSTKAVGGGGMLDIGFSTSRFQRAMMLGACRRGTTAAASGIVLTWWYDTCYNPSVGWIGDGHVNPRLTTIPFLSPARTLVVEQACPSLFFSFRT